MAGEADLAEDGVSAESSGAFFRIEEGVDGRQAHGAEVGDGHGQQAAVVAEFDEPRGTPGGGEEALKVLRGGIVHAAAAMAFRKVTPVQLELLVGARRRRKVHLKVGIAPLAAALAAGRYERLHRDAAGNAGGAAGALRAVDVAAGAAKSLRERAVVDLRQFGRTGVDHEVLRRAFGVVAAGVGQGLEKSDGVGLHAASVRRRRGIDINTSIGIDAAPAFTPPAVGRAFSRSGRRWFPAGRIPLR